jgi:hypothetical protein
VLSTLRSAAAQRPAERELFAHLIDDAAVFPPGSAPLDRAVQEHRGHQDSGYAGLLGPLLVPASRAVQLAPLAEGAGYSAQAPLSVVLVGRPGVQPGVVTEALEALRPAEAVSVVGVEAGWTPDWRGWRPRGVPLTLEVPRGEEQPQALADIAPDSSDAEPLQAKFRTGATPHWAWPDETELATFIRSAVDHDLGFKLTGGLHHAVRGSYVVDGTNDRREEQGPEQPAEQGEEQHGVLNVLCAVRWALNGEEVAELAPLLAERDPAVLVSMVTRMSTADASIVRAFFTAYGCCGVTDPIGELATLNLVEVT